MRAVDSLCDDHPSFLASKWTRNPVSRFAVNSFLSCSYSFKSMDVSPSIRLLWSCLYCPPKINSYVVPGDAAIVFADREELSAATTNPWQVYDSSCLEQRYHASREAVMPTHAGCGRLFPPNSALQTHFKRLSVSFIKQ
ncbi:predicted protein [Lichtheimia corymbifera JMRC:FSU:9682]|uniref:Uncharacterized protein n=1 Tax=Lichtheimia corymbifera JMRC:FSU:9682 TaxID=1263082 RepID=A0A068S8B7_9FUNG|nr:predicted protein [Lichtheimia corymbifera JMRC:FSU:9682]